MGGAVQQALSEMIRAVDQGGFSRDEAQLTRTPARLDAKGWEAVARELHKTLQRIDGIVAATEERLKKDPGIETVEAMAVMALFQRPSLEGDGAGNSARRAAGRKPTRSGGR